VAVAVISDFTKKVLQYVKNIPPGKVATYKQIAELAGKPQGSRGVSWILHTCSTPYKLPWHRVLNSKGRISFDRGSFNYKKQKRLLESEGVRFSDDGELSLKIFQWKKKPKVKAGKRPRMFQKKS
jgi:methylated-DNA-protein-cysteine methyltransferase-like protein